jgi:hypothetical protein
MIDAVLAAGAGILSAALLINPSPPANATT